MKHLLIIFLLGGLAVQSTAQTRAEKKQAKKELQQKSFMELKEWFEKGEFEFVAEWANTQKGRRVNLISNPNSLIVRHAVLNADLPYFGVVQVGNMSGDGGINVEDEPLLQEKIKYNEKKFRLIYSFEVKTQRGELLNCIFTIQANQTASLSIRSSQRNQITYTGVVRSLD